MHALQEKLRGIEGTIRTAVEDTRDDVLDSDLLDEEDDNLEGDPVGAGGAPFTIEDGTELVLRNKRGSRRAGGDLELLPSQDEQCRIEPADGLRICLDRQRRRVVVRWHHGLLRAFVPRGVASLRAGTLGGDIKATGMPCPMVLKTAGGDLFLEKPAAGFTAKTLGGKIRLSLPAGWKGEASAVTLGGDIRVGLDEPVPPLHLEAATLGGRIRIPEDLGPVEREETPGGGRVRARWGTPGSQASDAPGRGAPGPEVERAAEEKDDAATPGAEQTPLTGFLRVKTLGGNISVERSAS